jgi:hypothetical protein
MRSSAPLVSVLAILAVNACAHHPVYGVREGPSRPLSETTQQPSDNPLPLNRGPKTVPSEPQADQARSPDGHVPKRPFGRR